ncbi:hypothetical protein VZT92_010135 [Zoarces viviparus]
MSCEEAQLHKERLQALAEKRKRQTEIEEKRSQLDDLVLQLQHLKSKATRERWLLQGIGAEEEPVRRKQLEQDEEQGKRLEDIMHRLEFEIGTLENEESLISAKEQVLRERLKETERSIEDLQKGLMSHDGDATGCMSAPLSDCTDPDPDHVVLATQPRTGPPAIPRPALFAMEINVEQDAQTGEQRILSANRVSPLDSASRGVKIYDDGRKVVYEVTSSGGVSTSTMENGWSSAQVDQLIQRAARPVVPAGDGSKGQVTVTPAAPQAYISPADVDDLSPPSCAPPSVPSSPPAQVTLQREARLGMMPPAAPITTQPSTSAPPGGELSTPMQASAEHPITMVFLGYQDVDDMSESRRLLGFDGAVKAEVVLIDEDDEKSLREKTVTDQSIIDGTAADLVSGRPATSEAASTELSFEHDSTSSPPTNPDANTGPLPGLTPATGYGKMGVTVITANGYQAPTRNPHTAMKLWRAAEDVSDTIPRERALKSVSFQESVSVITDSPANMELESQQIQHGCLSSPSNRTHNEVMSETPDSEVVQEIRYLDQVLDAASETPTNGNSSPSEHSKPISIDGSSPSVCVSASSPVNHQSIVVEGLKQTTFLHQEASAVRTNGHVQGEESGRAKFELRAFQEERRPAKLFTPGEEQQVRVTRRRPSGEVQELERERQELIKDQAVKKNPGIARRWWNPPQEVPLEDQLDVDQLESLKKYQERKQQKETHTYTYTQPQVSGPPTMVTFDPELNRKEEILEEQINFSSARRQFLQAEATKRDVAPHMYSAKPFSKSTTRGSQWSSDIVAETGEGHVTWSAEDVAEEFTCARAVMTILPDEEETRSHFYPAFHPEESDSGLDELSLRSQDTTVFSLDNISDSGASLPPTPLPLTPVSPPTPQPTTPVNGRTSSSPTEDVLEYHAGVLVQNAIQNALAAQDGEEWQPSELNSSQLSTPVSPSSTSTSSPVPVSSSPVSSGGAPSLQSPVSTSPAPSNLSPQPDRRPEVRVSSQEKPSESQHALQQQQQPSSPAQQPQLQTPSPPPSQPVSPPQRPKNGGPRIKIQSSYARALASAPPPAQVPASSSSAAPLPRPTPVYRPPSPPNPEKPEFSYFSKYSEAAELRSTAAAARGPEAEAASGPFRLRSKKQRTLSMIEEEIRAAQQREEELKQQREEKPVVIVRPSNSSSSLGPARTKISPADKMKSNSLPARLTLTARTAPGKIEKVRPVPPVSPSPSEGALSDAGSEDSGGRPKNFMQTLMEDYETHKVKRREKIEDNSVLEATRVTRRKSDMARKWEAGIYANEDGAGEEEEEEEEEE